MADDRERLSLLVSTIEEEVLAQNSTSQLGLNENQVDQLADRTRRY